MATKARYYNIEGTIRNGFKLSRDYETLDFNFIKLGDEGVKAFAKSRSVKQLKRLTLSNNKLTAEGAQALAESSNLPMLESPQNV